MLTDSLYKCLAPRMRATQSGFAWPPPSTDNGIDWEPGDWVRIPYPFVLRLCSVGLHVTDQPCLWVWSGAHCWEVEVAGEHVGILTNREWRKLAYRAVRLLRPVAREEWLALRNAWLANDMTGLYGANLYRADLHGANLIGANLEGADLHGANLIEANLIGANLEGANLYRADLCWASLYGANLYKADLHGANLIGANLHGANLIEANLIGANLIGANLEGANLHGAFR